MQQGAVLLVTFVYTQCCAGCPIQRALPPVDRDGIRFVSVSLGPLTNTPATLKASATRMGADLVHWSFLTRLVEKLVALRAMP